jgi:hypothetical protein
MDKHDGMALLEPGAKLEENVIGVSSTSYVMIFL